MEFDTAELLPSGSSVDSPDVKRQMAINIGNGVSGRTAYKTMRKRVRIEARRQRELEEGRPPEVLLESFLEVLKHKLRRPPGLPKRVLTSAAKAAKHRRAKDKRKRETPCWWIANGKECFKGEWCPFKHMVPQVKGQTASKTGVSPPGLATDESATTSSSCKSDATSVCNARIPKICCVCDLARDYWIKCWDECSSSDSSVDGGDDDSHCDSEADVRYKYFTGNSWCSGHWKMDSWHSGHWETSD